MSRQERLPIYGFALAAALLCLHAEARAQTTPSRAASAPSAWPIYQAGRAQSGSYAPLRQGALYNSNPNASVYAGRQNPSYGAGYPGIMHAPSAYPYGTTNLYPYNRSYLYPYNYQDATTVPYYEIGSGGDLYRYSLQPPEEREANRNRADNKSMPPPRAGTAEDRTAAAESSASVTVIVPNREAVVTFQGQSTTTTGTKRTYKTPSLVPGAVYQYDVVARWRQGGADIQEQRTVDVTADSAVVIDFTRPAPVR